MYYNKGPNRICNLRADSLAQILTQSNVRSGNKMLVVESCVGLVVGAVLERLGGSGTVIQLYSGSAPVQQAVESFDFPKETQENLHSYPLYHVNALVRPGQQKAESINVPTDTTNEDKTSSYLTQGNDALRTSENTEAETDCQPSVGDPSKEGSSNEGRIEGNDEADNLSGDLPSGTTETKSDGQQEEAMDQTESSSTKGTKRKYPAVERAKRWQSKQEYLGKVKNMIEMCDSDGLIVVTKYNPTPIVLSLIEFVGPSRPIAVFCQYKEPLMDCYVQLRDRGGVVLLRLSETWLRGYQVLPNRTHPKIQMSGTGGYLLTGTTVELDQPRKC